MVTSVNKNPELNPSQGKAKNNNPAEEEPILCPHCRRTASNGIKCKGICVADSDY